MEKTVMQELIEFLDTDVELKMSDKKTVERINWYIKTYFLEKEKQQIIDARISVTGLNHASPTDDTNLEDAEKYYNQKYTQ